MYIEIEYCQGCSSHTWCTNHDESKYQGVFQQIQLALSPLPVQVVAVEHPRMGAFEVRFRSSRGSLLLASKLRSGKWPSVHAVYRKCALLLTTSEWTVSVLARKTEVLGLDVSSSYPFVVKAVLPESLGAVYGVVVGDQLISVGNENEEISDLPNIRVVLAALKARPVVARFRRVGEILCPRLEAPIDPPAYSLAPPAEVRKTTPVPPLALKNPPPTISIASASAAISPPPIATPAHPETAGFFGVEEQGPRTPPDEDVPSPQYVKAPLTEVDNEYAEDFDH